MLPTGLGGDGVQPAVDVGVVGPVKGEGLGVKKVPAAGDVRDGDLIGGEPVAAFKMCIHDFECRCQTHGEKAVDIGIALFFGQEVHVEPQRTRDAGHLVVVKEHPAQHLAPFVGRAATQLSGLGADIVLHDARLGQHRVAVFQDGHFGHNVKGAKFRAAGRAFEEVDEDGFPFDPGQGQRQRRLIGVSAFAEAMQFHHVRPSQSFGPVVRAGFEYF